MTRNPDATYLVEGMTCSHCVTAVHQHVVELQGVGDAVVDLATGRLEVLGEGFNDDQVKQAVREAGYRVAARV